MMRSLDVDRVFEFGEPVLPGMRHAVDESFDRYFAQPVFFYVLAFVDDRLEVRAARLPLGFVAFEVTNRVGQVDDRPPIVRDRVEPLL